MLKIESTYHASVERIDRLVACAQYLGVGDICYEIPDARYENTIRCLTTTGIIIIKSTINNKIITGYMATPKKVVSMYGGRVPDHIYRMVVRNNKKFAFLNEMQKKLLTAVKRCAIIKTQKEKEIIK